MKKFFTLIELLVVIAIIAIARRHNGSFNVGHFDGHIGSFKDYPLRGQ